MTNGEIYDHVVHGIPPIISDDKFIYCQTESAKNLVNIFTMCDDCKHLKIVNDGKVYAICEETDFEFMPFGTDTSKHFCAYGERKED